MNNPQYWHTIEGAGLAQGDFLSRCLVPVFSPDFGSGDQEVPTSEFDLIVLTQNCDLENGKARLVACSPIHSLVAFEAVNPKFGQKGRWEEVRKGRIEGLHMLASTTQPGINRESFVVDFREIYSLPFVYLSNHAEALGNRWRLESPFLEHFSQAFARFFMRVGLPALIPPFS
jgi:hypothetical protein